MLGKEGLKGSVVIICCAVTRVFAVNSSAGGGKPGERTSGCDGKATVDDAS